MSKIIDVHASEILDSRGMPTVSVKVILESNICESYSSPSGASTGSKEAVELRDNDERYFGKGILKAVNNVNTIIRENLIGVSIKDQKKIDDILINLDGTENKSKLGSNATTAVSIACLKAAAKESNRELYDYLNQREKKVPKLMFNIINGGKHADNNLDIQEFMIVPKKSTFREALRCACEVFNSLKTILKDDSLSTNVGDEGGFAPDIKDNKTALSYIVKAIRTSGYEAGKDVFIALDIAANSLYNEEKETYKIDNKFFNRNELLDYYIELCKEYPIISIEDAYSESDYEGFKLITESLGNAINIVGDDLFVTNKKELEYGVSNGLCNSIIIKPNQVGTFYEMLETVVYAKQNNYTCIMSHRSGETNDTFIIDCAVALGIPFVKAGSLCRGERICKFNRLLEIEESLEKVK